MYDCMFVKNTQAGITVEILPMEISIVGSKMLEMFMLHINENNEKQFQIIAVKRVQVVNRIEHVGEEGLEEQDRLHPAFGGI